MKTTPLPEIMKAANLGNLSADLSHSIINPPPVGIDPQARDLVATVFDCNLGHERAAAVAAYLAHTANVLPELVEALETAARELAARQAVNKVICERSGVPFTPCESLAKVETAIARATNVPVNS